MNLIAAFLAQCIGAVIQDNLVQHLLIALYPKYTHITKDKNRNQLKGGCGDIPILKYKLAQNNRKRQYTLLVEILIIK